MQFIYDDPLTGGFSMGCVDFACRRGQIAQAIYEGILNYLAQGGGGDDGGVGGRPCDIPPCGKGK